MATKAKRSRLIDLDDPEYVQQNLFLHPSVSPESDAIWPPIERTEQGFLEVVEQADREGYMGADLEFSRSGRPTILGVSCSDRCASLPWDLGLARKTFSSRTTKYVGHFILDADKPKIEKEIGRKIPVERWDSTELRHYILNSDFTSSAGKTEDDEDSNALGLMNIWIVLSLYTSLPNYKQCRNSACIGPCPRHDVFGYNAVDAFGPVGANHKMIEEMRRRNIPEKLYDDLKDLTLMCGAMTSKGIWVDRKYVAQLEEMWEAEKASMFPYELRKKGGKEIKVYGQYEGETWVPLPFAPTAPQQAIRYFEDHGMSLRGKGGKTQADKATVRKLLERKLREKGVDYEVSRFGGVELIEGEQILQALPTEIQWLFKLDCHKSTGKGLDSWFADDYFVDPQGQRTNGFLHPRFIVTGTVTGRLSSSKPNGTNVPKAGKRALVRRAFKPRHKHLKFLVSDKSNLELRVVLNYAGTKLEIPDAFSWLVSKSDGAFTEAAAQAGRSERDVAKRVSHAGSLLEGLKVYYDDDLRSTKVQGELRDKAIVLFDGEHASPRWEYKGGYIGFTGSNLAEGLFKSKTNEARRRALVVQEKYFNQFPQIRELQRSWSRQAEKGWVRTKSGRYVELYNNPEDDLKLCAAMFMQGGGADEVQECMRRFWYRGGEYDVPVLQIHDELVFEIPVDWTDDRCIDFMEPFYHPSDLFDGQVFPVEISVGSSWFGGIKGVDAGDRKTIWEKGRKVS